MHLYKHLQTHSHTEEYSGHPSQNLQEEKLPVTLVKAGTVNHCHKEPHPICLRSLRYPLGMSFRHKG